MPTIDPAQLDDTARYRLLIGAVVPRPIAWITTVDAAGAVNLAPFSFFTAITASPATLGVCIGHREPEKDTLANLRATGEAVVHLVPPALVAACHQSGAAYAHGVSEIAELGLATRPAQQVRPPRLAAVQVALECRARQFVPVGDPPTTLCLLEVVCAHIDEAVAAANGLPDPRKLVAAARLGERCYLVEESWGVQALPAQQVPAGKGLADG